MDGNHPNRKKDKYNPYTLSTDSNAYYISFTDGQGIHHKQEINREIYIAFNSFELDDISWMNETRRHLAELNPVDERFDNSIADPSESIENYVCRRIMYQKLHKAIALLPEVQRRRIRLYYFEGYSFEQIAQIEGCKHPAIIKSINAAKLRIYNSLK